MRPELRENIEEDTSRRLRRMYILALSAVAILTILGQILVQHAIRDQQADSHVINLAGSQRYLSQQIVKFAVLIQQDIDHSEYPEKPVQLRKFLTVWEKGHQGLQSGDEELNVVGKNSPVIKEMFREIEPYYKSIIRSASLILEEVEGNNRNQDIINKQVQNILQNEASFFRGMDAIVYQYDKEANARVDFLKKVEITLMSLTLLILLLEGMFIFRPAVGKIRETIHALLISEKRASSLADRLKFANINLEKSLKDLNDVNFAMDKATILVKTDRYGVITYVNEKFCEILKYRREELIGQRFSIISSHYHGKAFFDEMWEVISQGRIWNREIQNQAKDGSVVWMDATIVPLLGPSGDPESYISIYTDVTARFRQSINEQKLRSASILEGQERERKNIARELHDGLGQMLTALKFNFEAIQGGKSKKEQEKLQELKNLLRETIQETRRISFNLMPNVLNDYGLLSAVKHLTDQMGKHSDINIIFESTWENQRLGKTVEINLYRIIQEAVNNAVKYAEADEVKIAMDEINGFLRIEVRDNGKGFDPSDKKKVSRSGNGIVNMQERTDLINGEFRIQTAPGEGTRIFIKVPIPETVYEQGENNISR